MLSFKHLLAAAFVVGSLLNTGHAIADGSQKEESALKKYENYVRWGVAAGVGAAVWAAATYAPKTVTNKVDGNDVVSIVKETQAWKKALAWASPKVLYLPKFAETNKHAIQATTAAVILARYGTRALNSFVDGLKFHNMKQNFPNAWVTVPTEEKAAKAA